jgi:hypothetical protein
MTTNTSSIAVATSSVTDRVQKSIKQAERSRTPEQVARLEEVKRRADQLGQKGLLKRQTYSESSSADLRKRYLSGGA